MLIPKKRKVGYLSSIIMIMGILVFTLGSGNVEAGDPTQDLIRASMMGDLQKVERLIKEGANVNAKFRDGFTALMMASMTNRPAIAGLLLRTGANVDAKTSHGVTALMLASGKGNIEVANPCGVGFPLGPLLSSCVRVTSAVDRTVDEATAGDVRSE